MFAVLQRVDFYNVVECPPSGLWGGLVFAWRAGFDFDVVSVSPHIFNLVVFSDPVRSPWILTLVYGPTRWQDRSEFRTFLDYAARAFRELGCV